MKHYQHWMFGVMTLTATACVSAEDETLGEIAIESVGTGTIKNNHPISNELGVSATFSDQGLVDLGNEFFQDLGVNERTCGSCHKPAEGWTVSVKGVNDAFERSGGLDPIFRTNDGSNSPNADVSTEAARRASYSMLLNRGVIRVGIGIPAGAEFALEAVDDPYGFASAAELSLFRRPLPSANLTLIPVVMWDGRVAGAPLGGALSDQSNGATQGHAGAPEPISQEIRDSIVDFEASLFNAQTVAKDVGRLDAEGARGGPEPLATQAFTNARFNLFDAWQTSDNAARRAVWRGQELFNTRPRVGTAAGTCRGCHNAENIGTNRNGVFFNINTSREDFRGADQPLYTLRNTNPAHPAFNTTITTTDPGRALITGLWNDINRFKVPSLRALGARAPYFHGGSANTLAEVVTFYEEALNFDFTDAEEADMVAFLSAL
jgi:cytochrome c peroxidase